MKIEFKKRIYIPFILSQIILFIVLIYSSILSFGKLKKNLTDKRIEDFANSFDLQIQQEEKKLSILADEILSNPSFQSIFQVLIKNKRPDTSFIFQKYNSKHEINIFELGDKNGKVIYRFHRPNDFGDIKINQKIIQDAISGKESFSIEYGHSGVGLRMAVPIQGGDFTLLLGKVIDTQFLKSIQRGEILGIFLAINNKISEISNTSLYEQLMVQTNLTELQDDGDLYRFQYSSLSRHLESKESEFLLLILNYFLPQGENKMKISFLIVYDDTLIIKKQKSLISDISISSLVIMFFSMIISYMQINYEKSKLENTEAYLSAVEKKLVEKEKLAALGNLVSGFAHKLNTPLGAILASYSNVQWNINELYGALIMKLQNLSHDERNFIKEKIDIFPQNEGKLSRKELKEIRATFHLKFSKDYFDRIENFDSIPDLLISVGLLSDTLISEIEKRILPENLHSFLVIFEKMILVKKNLEIINKAAEKSKDFIKSLRFFSVQSISGDKEDVRILDLLMEVTHGFSSFFNSRISLQLIADENIDKISCYPQELRKVFYELILNSIQAIQDKGEIIIEIKEKYYEIEIFIKDSGNGIPNEIKTSLFEPFISSRSSGEGTGLGLFVSKKIIELHNGNIYFLPLNNYTTFQITLPKS